MNNYIPNQFSNVSQPYVTDIKQKAEQLKQNEQQSAFQNVQQYVKNAQASNSYTNYTNSVEQNAKQLRLQDAKNYIQQMNSKIGLQ